VTQSHHGATGAGRYSVSEMVDTEELLELSAAIKVIVDGIDSVVLPEGVADTQALAEAIASGESDFIEQLALTNPGTLEEAIDRVINDGNATTEWTAAEVPGVYVPSDGFSLLVFLEGGVGLEQDFGDEGAGAGEFQWSINEQGQLRLDLFEAAEPVGTWSAQSDSGEALGTATFNDNGSGTYQEGNEFLEFDWMVDGDGVLKLFLASDGPGVETDSLYKLADSQGDLVHAMLVYRVDGELDADLDSPDSGERPGAMGEVTLIFTGAN
jgi:hypothetical protein